MTRSKSTHDRDACERAAEWFVRRNRGPLDRADQAAFERWHADAANAAAYAAVERTWGFAGRMEEAASAADTDRLRGMVEAARRGATTNKGVRRRVAMAAALLVAVGALLWNALELGRRPATDTPGVSAAPPETYVTAVGERSTIMLDDGSQVLLNTDSRLRVAYGTERRQMTLLAGQALFEVEPDSSRPFVVQACDHQVVALGTAFDVRMADCNLQVTLIEGSIDVEDTAAGDGSEHRIARLDPGQQFRGGDRQDPEIHAARLEQVTSWRDGRLIFTDEPLRQAVDEVNRYSTRKIRLAEDALAELRVSGVFRTGRPDSFAAALTNYFDIAAEPGPSGDIILSPSGT